MRIGIDIGSTTVKIIVLDDNCKILYKNYQRHFGEISTKVFALQDELSCLFPNQNFYFAVSGSAALDLANHCHLQFVQEVFAEKLAIEKLMPDTNIAIELGGEDAKMLFLGNRFDARMNDNCAGGTGAFLDQMAALLNVKTCDLNTLAEKATTEYTIASRCGVFAKSDIQILLNQGVSKTDLAASIFSSVANQTITGLAKGMPITGKVLYLGGPLTFMNKLCQVFDKKLNVKGECPENSLYYVAYGAALAANIKFGWDELKECLRNTTSIKTFDNLPPLFTDNQDYQQFLDRHQKASVSFKYTDDVKECYLGIDCGSTTVKLLLIDEQGDILDFRYKSNEGNPVWHVRDYLKSVYLKNPNCRILSSAVTGYGEDLIKNAFGINYGIVETMAHFFAAKHFDPQVDFIIDIGGQDIKCLKIHNHAIDNIFFNEACSSGCGSFLQSFANTLGYDISEFAKLGIKAKQPANLGSRCTVFMNSSVKQAQKNGISIEDISAGLSISVVKNAIYKVIRPHSKADLGEHIVVQGGTFLNDCVLRALEKELDLEVKRPNIAGLMGAYGAALYCKKKHKENPLPTTLLNLKELLNFKHEVKTFPCQGCNNHCLLTLNSFAKGKPFISGNRCERPITNAEPNDNDNLYRYKLNLLKEMQSKPKTGKWRIGIPLGLNMYELGIMWQSVLENLGFEVIFSPIEDKTLYSMGQGTIPDDSVCYPAKLMHGHIKWLINNGCKEIFYPCMTYNIDEHLTDNCYNCPVVAYYPEVLSANIPELQQVHCYFDYLGLQNKNKLTEHLYSMLHSVHKEITKKDIKHAVQAGFETYKQFEQKIKAKGTEIINRARTAGKPVIVLAGQPYHIDPKINHGIDRLLTSFGVAVVSEDAIPAPIGPPEKLQILNQWTYHGRIYPAAAYAAQNKGVYLIQLVSFGCGCDAITADECQRILEEHDQVYTQIKIDDVDNLSAAKIRIRSTLTMIGANKKL